MAESLKFSQLDNELLIAPFDDVKQAAFYLPWALVTLDEDAGGKTQRAWLTFRERLIRLDAVAVDAARYQADEEEVLAAIAELLNDAGRAGARGPGEACRLDAPRDAAAPCEKGGGAETFRAPRRGVQLPIRRDGPGAPRRRPPAVSSQRHLTP